LGKKKENRKNQKKNNYVVLSAILPLREDAPEVSAMRIFLFLLAYPHRRHQSYRKAHQPESGKEIGSTTTFERSATIEPLRSGVPEAIA
jgi:hypothetical protein